MKKFLCFFVFICLLGLQAKADEVTFEASAPPSVPLNERFQLSYTINSDQVRDFRAPDLSAFNVLMGPASTVGTYSSNVNGSFQSVTTTTLTYTLMGKEEGTFNIEPATAKIKKANYSSNALVIKILPPDEKPAENNQLQESNDSPSIPNDAVFMRMTVSKNNVYEQEGFLVSFKLYASTSVQPTGYKFPEFEGFVVQEVELPQEKSWVRENYNGKNYNTVLLKQSVLYPQRTGNITIGAGSYDMIMRIPSQRKVKSIFDDFFDSYQDVKKTITTSPATIQVKALPSGKPASYSGGVGSFKLASSINTNNLKTNEALTIKLTISGNGNLRLVKNPTVVFPDDFEVYDPKVTNDIRTTASGMSGTKTIEYMAIPRYAGDFEIPAIQFSYFDLASGSYKTLSSEPYKIHVAKGEGGEGATPVVSNFGNRESVKYLGKDIRYLKQVKNIHFTPKSDIFFGSLPFWLIYICVTVLAVVFFIVYRKKVKENSDLALMRTRKANKMAVRRLKKAEALLKENKKEEFYDETMRAVWGYLSDKLNIPTADLTKDNIEAELVGYGVDQHLITQIIDVLNTCEFARYAPSQATDAMDKLFGQAVEIIEKMESTIKSK